MNFLVLYVHFYLFIYLLLLLFFFWGGGCCSYFQNTNALGLQKGVGDWKSRERFSCEGILASFDKGSVRSMSV